MQSIFSPAQLIQEFPVTSELHDTVEHSRSTICSMIRGQDPRLLVIVWPCSIHDPIAALEYAWYVQDWRDEFWDTLEIVMRTYWEKPRTTIGWKWLINDPYLDGTYDIESWLRIARKLLIDIGTLWVPTATEFLDPLSTWYISDLISWGAIGARTTESQTHRELASSLPCPIGFKNGTDGNIKIALDAMQSAKAEHTFLSISEDGSIARMQTTGNPDTHVILRWSSQWTNFDKHNVDATAWLATTAWLPCRVMIDVSHQNSQKNYRKQMDWINSVVEQIQNGDEKILGVMIESNIQEGSQSYTPGKDISENLIYWKSITDACVDISTTHEMLRKLAQARN